MALTPWDVYPSTIVPYGVVPPAVGTVVVAAGVAMGRDLSGNCQIMDDTQSLQMLGFTETLKKVTVDQTNTIQTAGITGDNNIDIRFPTMFQANIASAVAGVSEGKRVYWQFNNQVQTSPGSFGNYAGTIWSVRSSTVVLCLCPWSSPAWGFTEFRTLASTGNIVLSKWDINKAFQLTSTAAQTVTLPPSASVSSGDEVYFKQLGSGSFGVTILPAAGDKIQGSTSNYTGLGTAQFSRQTFVTDATGNWYSE